ncbi:MAG: bifunctional metallophosphatase/5'-nucleotidase, partial [Verrucomicrobiae bacterium]|nr:bifunctional metallophosphatase/5'-nucleotidase [Verrucomicrobiae bacterium]
ILVSHLQQIELEQELIPLLRGVDISIAGGSDTLLADENDRLRGGHVAGGPYPIVTKNASGEPALVLSTDGQYKYVGRLVVTFDAQGVIDTNSLSSAVNGAYATDEQGVVSLWGSTEAAFAAGTRGARVRQLTDAMQAIVTAKDANIVGKSGVYLEGRRNSVRTEESNLGNLTADANLFVAKQYDPSVVASIKNGGGIRAEIGYIDGLTGELLTTRPNPSAGKLEGDISQLDIENSLRFNNLLSVLTVEAWELKNILEHGVAQTRPGNTPGQFPQVGGLSFLYDTNRQAIAFDTNGVVTVPGDRIRQLAVTDANGVVTDLILTNGVFLGDTNRPIRLVTLNFMAVGTTTTPGLGGDGYPFPAYLTDRVDLPDVLSDPGAATFASPGSEQDAMAEYLAALFDVTPYGSDDTPLAEDRRIISLPAITPSVTRVAYSGGTSFEIQFSTINGYRYHVEYADGVGALWTPLTGGTLSGDGTVKTVTDPSAAGDLRVYRVWLEF